MTLSESQHPFASPPSEQEESSAERDRPSGWKSFVERAISFQAGLAMMLILLQAFPLAYWAELMRDTVTPIPSANDSEVVLWRQYEHWVVILPALFWLGTFVASILGAVLSLVLRCSLICTVMAVITLVLSFAGMAIVYRELSASFF